MFLFCSRFINVRLPALTLPHAAITSWPDLFRPSTPFLATRSALPVTRSAGVIKIQTVYKPGSVHNLYGCWTAIPLGRVLQPASRDQPGRRAENPPAPMRLRTAPAAPIRSCSRWGLPCQACHQARGALLPHRFTLTSGEPSAVCFLWHYPWGRPRRPLAGTAFPWSPDFPPASKPASGRPTVWISGPCAA